MELLYQILQLPERSLINKKITKAFFKRNFDLTLTERKLLDDSSAIVQIEWLASLKPNNVNIEEYINSEEVFEEIQVISVSSNSEDFGKIHQKVIELIQKHIPYHVLLCIYDGQNMVISTSGKRVNQNDSNRRTIEKILSTSLLSLKGSTQSQQLFLSSLSFDKLDKHNLKTLYDSYSKSIVALHAANITGEYRDRPIERSKEDVEILALIAKRESEILQLQSQSKKESQLNIQVKINTEVQQKRTEILSLKNKLLN